MTVNNNNNADFDAMDIDSVVSTQLPLRVNLYETAEKQDDEAVLFNQLFTSDLTLSRPHVPPSLAPRLTAETTADFITDAERLEDNLNYEQEQWNTLKERFDDWDLHLERLRTLAFVDQGTILRLPLQALVIQLTEAVSAIQQQIGRVQDDQEVVRDNFQDLKKMMLDVMANRPTAHRPLLGPGKLLEVDVTTPTLGKPVTDEDKLLREFGISLTGH